MSNELNKDIFKCDVSNTAAVYELNTDSKNISSII